MARRLLTEAIDKDGCPIVQVQLNDGRLAIVDGDHFHRLMDLGLSPNWFTHRSGHGGNYVRAHISAKTDRDNVVMVLRLIVRPAVRGVVVRHRWRRDILHPWSAHFANHAEYARASISAPSRGLGAVRSVPPRKRSPAFQPL
ncbi:hypothetical protein DEM27_12500 [Metarhizobium album]|uniref:Uncharacterized protein n=1 Tax=Metarhizobium album TaxID=2182425 RepID=A0A2U2DSG4_9HYPH|nr:hypothetical protein DEM27_12500 [Rhizobium album]